MEQDQERLLEEASSIVREQGSHMKKAIETDCLRDALKHASNLICELRTSFLSPKNYYELYMQVFHELQYLASFFADKKRHGRKLSELYESVQHAGNILPRLYLLVTVGSCYIRSQEAPHAVKAILTDMTELCKAVQHPMRGLFLRYYLTQMCKDYLPDNAALEARSSSSSSSSSPSDNNFVVTDAFEFLFQNFTESARLWVRLQHQGSAKERPKRERQRHDLRVLVGANLVRMAQLEGMTPEFYATEAAPRIIKQITSFKDVLAQQYLMDCVIQVFSDDCHLKTLSFLLDSFLSTQSRVDLKPILLNLMNRLSEFAKNSSESILEGLDIFGLFHSHILQLFQRAIDNMSQTADESESKGKGRGVDNTGVPAKTISATSTSDKKRGAANNVTTDSFDCDSSLSLSGLLEIQLQFLNFTLILYPKNINYVDRILCATGILLSSFCHEPNGMQEPGSLDGKTNLKHLKAGKQSELPQSAAQFLMEILAAPLRKLSLSILQMEHYPNLIHCLDQESQRQVARSMVDAVLDAGQELDDLEAVAQLFTYISPLFQKQKKATATKICRRKSSDSSDEDETEKSETVGQKQLPTEDFLQQQQYVCRLVHLIHHKDTDIEFAMLSAARNATTNGNAKQAFHLIHSLVFCAMRLIPRILSREIASSTEPRSRIGARGNMVTALQSDSGDTGRNLYGNSDVDSEAMGGQPDTSEVIDSHPAVASQKIFHFIHKACLELAVQYPELALNSFLHAAIVANDAEIARPSIFEPICYEFLSQALVCFEEGISDSKAQSKGIIMIVAVMCSYIKCLEADNYDNIAAKVTQYSARLLRKTDSCRAVLVCSNLFWNNVARRSEVRVIECLQKCLKTADLAFTSSSAHVVLFVEILEKYIYYFEQSHPGVSKQAIVDLVSLCAEHLSFSDFSSSDSSKEYRTHFSNLVEYITRKVNTDCKYKEMSLNDVEGIKNFIRHAEETVPLTSSSPPSISLEG